MIAEHSFAFRDRIGGTARCSSTKRSLTHLLDYTERGLAVKATRPYPCRPIQERFWEKVDKDGPVPAHRPELGPCWVWTRSTTDQGYGKFSISRGVWERAHAVSWEFVNDPIPAGLFVMHRCDNPPCVRPDHLKLGTARDNTQDMLSKGRGGRPAAKGERNSHAKLVESQVVILRQRFDDGEYLNVLADEFGIHLSAASLIVNGRTWPDAGGPIRPRGQLGRRPRKEAA